MGRHPNPDRKVELLDDIVEYLLDQGTSELSLRPLAKALGTSTYTIAYQFGSKEQMLVDALDHIVATYQHRNRRVAALSTKPSEVIDRYWIEDHDDDGTRWRQLLFEVLVAGSRRDGDDEVSEQLLEVRRERMHNALRASSSADAEVGSTIVMALLNGLALDEMATGDTARVEAALDWLKDAADGSSLGAGAPAANGHRRVDVSDRAAQSELI